MTLTEAPPAPAAREPEAPAVPAGSWFTTADHRRLGRLYIGTSLLFLLVGGAVGMLMRAELAEPGISLVGPDYGRLFSLHATVLPLLFLGPLWTGLATFIVPAQVGAPGLALPRLQATTFWLYALGGTLLLVSYVAGTPHGAGLTLSQPISGQGNAPTDLWIGSLGMVAVASVLAAVVLLTTIVRLRAPGARLLELPLFTWSVLVSSAVIVVATPVFVAGLLLLGLDQHFGGPFFADTTAGTQVVWQHMLWLFGRPEVYLLTLPALGAACDIAATAARRPLPGGPAPRVLLAAFGVLSLGAWAAGTEVASAVVLPTYSLLTALVVVPIGLLALMWLGTVVGAPLRFHLPVLHVLGALALLAFAAVNTGVAAVQDVQGGSAWTTGHLHAGVFGPPVVLAAGALHQWAPRLLGRRLLAGLGLVEVALLTGGFLVMGLASYLLGYDGAPWHVGDMADQGSWTNLNRLAAAGGVLVVLGVLALVANLLVGGRRRPLTDDDDVTIGWVGS
jgi:cytochrome c oxidase subunit 1